MALHGSGLRNTARVLGISTDTVLNARKKKRQPCISVNQPLLAMLSPGDVAVRMRRAGAAEADALWSLVKRTKKVPRWRWHAMDHRRGQGVGPCVWGNARTRYF